MFAPNYSKGKVIDKETKEPLYNASIIKVSESGEETPLTVTNEDGLFYSSSFMPIDKVKISYIGYETKTFPVKNDGTYELSVADNEVGEVVVIGKKEEKQAPKPNYTPYIIAAAVLVVLSVAYWKRKSIVKLFK